MVQAHHVHSTTPKPSERWMRSSDVQRFHRLLLCREAASDARFEITRVHGVEVIVKPRAPLEAGMLGMALRDYEGTVRRVLDEPVEIYCDSQRDQNKPRHPDQRRKIQAWVEARQAIKIQRRDAQ